ncbi:MAG: hypothetical protein ACTSU5_03395 [Promethearchaeota archaeon]
MSEDGAGEKCPACGGPLEERGRKTFPRLNPYYYCPSCREEFAGCPVPFCAGGVLTSKTCDTCGKDVERELTRSIKLNNGLCLLYFLMQVPCYYGTMHAFNPRFAKQLRLVRELPAKLAAKGANKPSLDELFPGANENGGEGGSGQDSLVQTPSFLSGSPGSGAPAQATPTPIQATPTPTQAPPTPTQATPTPAQATHPPAQETPSNLTPVDVGSTRVLTSTYCPVCHECFLSYDAATGLYHCEWCNLHFRDEGAPGRGGDGG